MGKSTISMAIFNSFLYVYRKLFLAFVPDWCRKFLTDASWAPSGSVGWGMNGWLAGGDDATQQIGHSWTLKCGQL